MIQTTILVVTAKAVPLLVLTGRPLFIRKNCYGPKIYILISSSATAIPDRHRRVQVMPVKIRQGQNDQMRAVSPT